MATSGSRGRGQEIAGSGAGGDALDTLVITNPDLVHLPAADLVARINRDERIRFRSDFADVALVLARLAEAEDRVRKVDEESAGLLDTICALEDRLRAANAEALARRKRNSLGSDSGGISGGERAVAREDDYQSLASLEPKIGAAQLSGGEWPRDLNLPASETIVVAEPPAGEIEDGEITPCVIKATPAEIGDNMPRPSPLRRIGATLPDASSMPDELAKETAVERAVVDVAVRSSQVAKGAQPAVVDSHDVQVSEAAGKRRKQEPAAASASEYKEREQQPLKKPKPAGVLGVASVESDGNSQVEEMEENEAQLWKKLDILKAQVAAWESEYDAADAAQVTLQAAAAPPPPVEDEVQTMVEAEALETSEVARLQEKIILCERRLKKVQRRAEKTEKRLCVEITECKEEATKTEALLRESEATVARLQEKILLCEKRNEEVNVRAKKTEERLCAEITDCKEKAAKTKADLWEAILLAHTSAVTKLEVWKHSATTEAQAQIRAASMIVAWLRDEIEAWKQRASEIGTRLQNQDQNIATLQDMVEQGIVKAEYRIRVTNFELRQLQKKIEAMKQDNAMEVASKIHRATKMEEYLQEKIQMLENKVVNLEARGSNISRSDRTVPIDEHNHSCMVPESGMVSETGVHRVVPAGANNNKKARRQKGVSFYDEVFKSEMEKRMLKSGNEENEEILKKQAAAAASKELYLRCLPYLPTQLGSQTVEDSGEMALVVQGGRRKIFG